MNLTITPIRNTHSCNNADSFAKIKPNGVLERRRLVTVYVVEQGLILPIQPVDQKSNEIKALPPVLKALAHREVVFAFDALNTQKNMSANY
ncbi:MAG: hypothetical protein HC810_04490 [Acaryochloridaceae cyanobacterium RL_2_7]|nr:hypothetical protein [Acaryochloridaceae cyanobacterium RL_2_7]